MQQANIRTYIQQQTQEEMTNSQETTIYQHLLMDITEMQFTKHLAHTPAKVAGTRTTLAFLALTIRSSFVAAITTTRLVLVCSVSAGLAVRLTPSLVSAWLCPYFSRDLVKIPSYRAYKASVRSKNTTSQHKTLKIEITGSTLP